MTLEVVILAAGEGKRMKSALPKVLHAVGGIPMIAHVINTADALAPAAIHVVIGHGGDRVKTKICDYFEGTEIPPRLSWATQAEQLGTGHAVMQAMDAVDPAATLLVLYGDVPMITQETLKPLAEVGDRVGLLTAHMDDPTGLGRILRDDEGRITGIIEEKDASDSQRAIRECNTGFISGPAALVKAALEQIDCNNAQQEYYLTDVIGHCVGIGRELAHCAADSVEETLGVNSKIDLARVERVWQRRQAEDLMTQGVTLLDPARIDVRGHCSFGRDCTVDVNVILEGNVEVGDDCRIGANTVIRNSRIAAGTVIEPNCIIDNAVVGERCIIGPFARLRPEAELDDEVHIGNFVEIKKSRIGHASKANHLAYVGDSSVGARVNIGAGTITCNYDGANKYRTVIGDDVFVGSNSQLVAPVNIGNGASIGAGSTVTQDVPDDALAVARSRQRMISNWKKPVKKPT